MVKLSKICAECGTTFFKKRFCSIKNWNDRTRYCSRECSNKHTLLNGSKQPTSEQRARGERNHMWKGGQIKKECSICNKFYLVDPYRDKQTRFCSRKCFIFYQKTPMGRLAKSEAIRNGINAEFYRLTITFAKFKNLLRRCSRYNMWRMKIFTRDDFTCQECGKRGGKIHADHIKPFISIILEKKIRTYEQALETRELWDIENGRTMCLSCHYKTDTFGSKVHRVLLTIVKHLLFQLEYT